MNEFHLTVEQPGPDLTHVVTLTQAFETERKLLDELARVMVTQREAITADDLEGIDESVFRAHRVMRTLKEARRQRRTLLQLIGAEPDFKMGDLDAMLGADMTPALAASRDNLLEAADRLSRELTLNRSVIGGALAMGSELIQAFTGRSDRPALYTEGAEPEAGGAPGAFLNTRA